MTQRKTKVEISLAGEPEAVATALQEIAAMVRKIKTRAGIQYCQEFGEDF